MPTTARFTTLIVAAGLAAIMGMGALITWYANSHNLPLVEELAKTGTINVGTPLSGESRLTEVGWDGYKAVSTRANNTIIWSTSPDAPTSVWNVANSDSPAGVTEGTRIVGLISAYRNPDPQVPAWITACDVVDGTVDKKTATHQWQRTVAASVAKPDHTITGPWGDAKMRCRTKKVKQTT